ncbi:MAG: DNA (cytosine-5-)-methyltransferase [Planctomycetes bacterium]|nr:DNA (cytosine-5-)-methyltransferase [Planctomycetota bacterium]
MAYGVELQRRPALLLDPHPGAPTPERWREWALGQKLPRAVDLFSGGGGLSLGLERAGYKVILAVDHDARSLATHRHNFAGLALDLDLSSPAGIADLLRRLDGIDLDLVAGGPPCQPFSRAGRSKIRSLVEDGTRDANDSRRALWRSFIQVVEQLRPRAVLLENVPDMALGDDLAVLREMLDLLERAGYEPDARLVEAWRHGVPQHRQRLIVAAVRDGAPFQWPQASRRVNVRDAIGDLPRLRDTTGDAELPYGRPDGAFQRRARTEMDNGHRGIVWDHVTRPVRADDRVAFNLMRPDTRYSDLPAHLRRYRTDIFDDKYKRLGWDELSRSITAHIAKDGYWYIHPGEPRTLTVREAARIQTFPDHFRFAGSRSDAFRQIGNAVPPALAESVAGALLRSVRGIAPAARRRRSERLKDIRTRLLAWAKADAPMRRWWYPGDPWRVLAAVVLEGRLGIDSGVAADFLARFPDEADAKERAVAEWARPLGPRTVARAERLVRAATLLRAGAEAWFESDWEDAAALTDAQMEMVRLVGLQDDGVLLTAGALRLAARFTGTQVHRKRSRSDGRMLLARILGVGADVPSLNAAIVLLGATTCTATSPRCSQCPLAADCAGARRPR